MPQVHPYCAQCRHAVAKADLWQDPLSRVIHIKAWCHGESEERTIPDRTDERGDYQQVMFRPLPPMLVREDERPMPEDDH